MSFISDISGLKKSGYFLDFSNFNKKYPNVIGKIIPRGAEKGMFNAANELLHDAVTKPPQAPFKKGDLWGSRSGTGKENSMPIEIKEDWKTLLSKFGFNISYAAKQHEAEPGRYKYTRTGAKQPGPKFLQTKMAQYAKKYAWIIAETIRRAK
jgi:hypothetical protein